MKNEKNEQADNLILKKEKSGLEEFIERPTASYDDVLKFEKMVRDNKKSEEVDFEIEEYIEEDEEDDLDENEEHENFKQKQNSIIEKKDIDYKEIEESLSEIYHDESGEAVDVSRLDIKQKRGVVFWFLSFVFLCFVFAGAGFGVYNYFFNIPADANAVELDINGPESVMTGEEFFYEISYRNFTKVGIRDGRLELSFPDNFIFLDSLPEPTLKVSARNSESTKNKIKNATWNIGELNSFGSGFIKIKGKIINKKDSSNIIFAGLSYIPENLVSLFKKEKSFNTRVDQLGFDFLVEHPSTALVGEKNSIHINLKIDNNISLEKIFLTVSELEKTSFSLEKEKDSTWKIENVKDNTWSLSDYRGQEGRLSLNYEIEEKIADNANLELSVFYLDNDKEEYILSGKTIPIDIMKSDLNLNLFLNGSKSDQAVSFGDNLNYSITYANKGETSMRNVIVMAVLGGPMLDWSSLEDKQRGSEKGNTITWTQEEIPALKELSPNQEGTIDFFIKVGDFKEAQLAGDFQIKSYAQYSVGNKEDFKEEQDNMSNTIVSKINSNFSLKESIRYFSTDNIPVGFGPLPPKVGEESGLKVYWTVKNNLNELSNTKVELKLPEYVSWQDRSKTSVGEINYDSSEHKIVWQIGRLPITVLKADAEFNISFIPNEEDRGKIMVLLPGSTISAIDNETKAEIKKTGSPKTSKLEDDDIAILSNDGLVR